MGSSGHDVKQSTAQVVFWLWLGGRPTSVSAFMGAGSCLQQLFHSSWRKPAKRDARVGRLLGGFFIYGLNLANFGPFCGPSSRGDPLRSTKFVLPCRSHRQSDLESSRGPFSRRPPRRVSGFLIGGFQGGFVGAATGRLDLSTPFSLIRCGSKALC